MAFRTAFLGIGLAAGVCSLAFAGAEVPGDLIARALPVLEDAAPDENLRLDGVRETSFAHKGDERAAAPAKTVLAQEGKASGHFTGRVFLAKGRRDGRIEDVRYTAAAGTVPEGWRDGGKKIAHAESGLECAKEIELKPKTAGESGRMMMLASITQYDQRGRDVSCGYAIDGEASITIYASYYPKMAIEEHAAGAVAAIRQNFSVKGALPVTIVEISRKGDDGETVRYPAPLAGGFDVGDISGVPYKTAIWLAETHGWHVKARATYQRSDTQAEIIAAIMFGVAYVGVNMKNRTNPTTDGAEA